ncbi:MAG: hypothetical protein IPI39_11895 [Candidatus Obscuribacter sp.]|nr:hypothetical protein [Candidatus Obscuribacter sp.]
MCALALAAPEPSVDCNITKASTVWRNQGDEVVVWRKVVYLNAWYGHQIACCSNRRNSLRVLITDLPEGRWCEQFSIVNYGIHALRHIHNKGIKFNGLRVPLANLA